MINTKTLSDTISEILRRDAHPTPGTAQVKGKPDPVWAALNQVGTRLWLDTGDVEQARGLWCSNFDALTTNNTLLNREVQKGIYDELIRDAASAIRQAAPDIDQKQLVLEIGFVLNAHHGLRLVELFDAYVSVELHTDLAHDVQRSVAYGKRYYDICPERFYVKVPLTPAGLLAAGTLRRAGVPINFTLGFSARQNYLAALLAKPKYVNVFMGRLNAFVADNGLGDGTNVGEKATLATQRELLRLREAGKTTTSLIGASMRAGPQVAALAGLDVYTMPPKVAADYHANPSGQVTRQVDNDPDIPLAAGVQSDDFSGATLWDVPEAFRRAVDDLLAKDIDALIPGDIQEHFNWAGLGDFLPVWTQDDLSTVTKDGKIPNYQTWKDRLAGGQIGLDALMNISALQAFATDQKALDDRIRSLI